VLILGQATHGRRVKAQSGSAAYQAVYHRGEHLALSWRVKAAGGTVARTHLRMGEVDLEIVGLAKEIGADLIVMGCRGHRGIRRAIEGSTSERLSATLHAQSWWYARTREQKHPSGLPSCKEEVDKGSDRSAVALPPSG
jgi:hypothetical protein